MNESFQLAFNSGPLQALGYMVLSVLVYLFAALLPTCGVLWVFYFLLTLPMRRNERARLFLDLLELGLKEGRTPESAVAGPAGSHDRSLGVRFHLLAAHLEQGVRLSQALDQTPRLLPPQIRTMLKAGERIGDVTKVLPACRQFLKDGVSHVRGALNYLLLLALTLTPAMIIVPVIVRVKILPKFEEIFAGMAAEAGLPAFTRFVFAGNGISTVIQVAVLGCFWLIVFAYVEGPPHRGWFRRWLPGLTDRVSCHLPWRRERMQRDFSTMLAVLLDAEVPEAEAVGLAAEATGNLAMRHRATRTRALLQEGVKLPEAIGAMDDSKELRWRLSNALRSGRGFLRALTGWHEALDARAFQSEQAAAQITTTALVLFNGVIVASIVIAVFLALIQLINEAVLW